jgi:hypothetical protein
MTRNLIIRYLESVDVEDLSESVLQQVGEHVPIDKVDTREPSYSELQNKHSDIRDGLMAVRYQLSRGDVSEAQSIVEDLLNALD